MESPRTASNTSDHLVRLLAEDQNMADFLNGLAQASAQRLSGPTDVLCGILQSREKRNTVVASSSASAEQMDETQAGFDEGPCLDAQRTEQVIRVPDVRHESRWPDYMTEARKTGIRSIVSIPLRVEGPARAAMNLYAEEPQAFGDEEIAVAEEYADLAAKVLVVALRLTSIADVARDRQAAMESRTVIDVAAGIIMAQNRCSHEEAVTILKNASSHRNIKLRVLAEELVKSLGQAAPATRFEP